MLNLKPNPVGRDEPRETKLPTTTPCSGLERPARHVPQYVGDNAKEFTTTYGNVSASVRAIQRGLLWKAREPTSFRRADADIVTTSCKTKLTAKASSTSWTADKLMNPYRPYATRLWMLPSYRSCLRL
jgi:hypothetical protein